MVEAWERRSRVSETVVTGEDVRRAMSDSIAAMGGVRSGSAERRAWYLDTMSKDLEAFDAEGDSDGFSIVI